MSDAEAVLAAWTLLGALIGVLAALWGRGRSARRARDRREP